MGHLGVPAVQLASNRFRIRLPYKAHSALSKNIFKGCVSAGKGSFAYKGPFLADAQAARIGNVEREKRVPERARAYAIF